MIPAMEIMVMCRDFRLVPNPLPVSDPVVVPPMTHAFPLHSLRAVQQPWQFPALEGVKPHTVGVLAKADIAW
jgi:hypothetical protein